MAKITSSLFVAGLLAAGLQAAPAQAQSSRTYVSAAIGDDAKDCSRLTPCRTFQGAHDKTNADGEITVLDPGGYGGVTITKSISIVNDGVGEASILVSGGADGITINAGPAAYINLRGLTVQGIGGGGNGLRFNSGFSLTITNCVFRNHSSSGIAFYPIGSSNLAVSNTLVGDNGGSGIDVDPEGNGNSVKVVLSRVESYNNKYNGVRVAGNFAPAGTVKATVVDSVAAGNSSAGFFSDSLAGAVTQVLVFRSVSINNAKGVAAKGQNALLRVGRSTVTGNYLSGSTLNTAVLYSYGDNKFNGNQDGDPGPFVIAKK